MAEDNRLGQFLRAQRARVTPGEVGLPDIGSRRVKGLRREEVAVLAGVSVDYYARLEQGRERTPSSQIMDAIAGALRLGKDAREHVYRLARLTSSTPVMVAEKVGPQLRQMMDNVPNAAAYIVNPAFRVLAANRTAVALIGAGQYGQPVRYLFLDPAARDYFLNWEMAARAAVSGLRLASGYTPAHPEVTALESNFAAIAQSSRRCGMTTPSPDWPSRTRRSTIPRSALWNCRTRPSISEILPASSWLLPPRPRRRRVPMRSRCSEHWMPPAKSKAEI